MPLHYITLRLIWQRMLIIYYKSLYIYYRYNYNLYKMTNVGKITKGILKK